jgi:hypothetical protein
LHIFHYLTATALTLTTGSTWLAAVKNPVLFISITG